MSLNVGAGLPGLGFGLGGLGAMTNLGGCINVGGGTTGRRALTEGIPDPSAVQRQKEQYARSLEDQLRKGVEVLAATHKQQTDLLHAQANQEKHRYNIALDQQVKQRELELSQQYNEQLMRLQQAAQVQRADLEQQACGLTLEYQQRKVQEEYMAQQQGIQNQHAQAQTLLNVEIGKLTNGFPGISPSSLMERVQANVQAGNGVKPMASYALPMLGAQQPPPVPMATAGMRPYVPPPGVMMAPPGAMMGAPQTAMLVPPKIGGPMLSYLPQAGPPGNLPGYLPLNGTRSNLSYVPSAGVVAAPSTRPSTSYVPPAIATAMKL